LSLHAFDELLVARNDGTETVGESKQVVGKTIHPSQNIESEGVMSYSKLIFFLFSYGF